MIRKPAALAALALIAGPAWGQEPAGVPAPPGAQAQASTPAGSVGGSLNPFGGFETHRLDNGLKVWLGRLEGARNVSVTMLVPYGHDRDPPGKEQLAHFTEHMLFGDHEGRTEQEIKDEIEGIGGVRNGVTGPSRTYYYASVAREHAALAIDWLANIVEPHAMEPDVVDRGRQPVAVEINARPRQFFEHVGALLNPPWLLPAGFWEREFGMQTRTPLYDAWASLQSITPEDLRGFYDRYYAPAAMTLLVVGDLDLETTLEHVDRAFGGLPARDPAPRGYSVEDPGRRRATYSWGYGSDVGYDRRFKLFEPTAEDDLYALFIRDLLFRRLNQRLRYGERKAAYTPSVSYVKRGPAAYLRISGDVNEDELDYAFDVFEEEIRYLREGSLDAEQFEADRRAVVERLRTGTLTAEALSRWARGVFYDRDVHADFPDVVGFYQTVTQEDLARFARSTLVPERELLSISFQQPISQAVLALLVVLLVVVTHRAVSSALTEPIEMRRIRYVARLKSPLPLRIARALVLGGLGLALARLALAGIIWVGSEWVATIDVWALQMGAWAALVSGSLTLVLVYLSRFPRKILVFPDHLRIKSRAYASRVLGREDVNEVSERGFASMWLGPSLFGTTLLTVGILRPGIYLGTRKGRSLFFSARDRRELLEVLAEWKRGDLEPGSSDVGRAPGADEERDEDQDVPSDHSEFHSQG